MRSSFARWQPGESPSQPCIPVAADTSHSPRTVRRDPDDYQVLSALISLRRLDLILASPMRLPASPLPKDLGLLQLYRAATQAILTNLSSTLTALNLTFEPGEGSWRVISAHDVDAPRDLPYPISAEKQVDPEPGGPAEFDWTYGRTRSEAVDVLFGGLEDLFVDPATGTLSSSFANLGVLSLHIWDTDDGMHDGWWIETVLRKFPRLRVLAVLSVEVIRGWTVTGISSLWEQEHHQRT
ncbi:hypothetical protein C8Q76DRAFT_22023 [Earliella scabrosa]|nr:hypothetical protein C8Q76DRAFT_22023 [Earliella scabrosa]